MTTAPWWSGATPHISIREGRVDEALFEAKLGEAIRGRGPKEYREAKLFFEKTFLTAGLRQLLLDILHTLNGKRVSNAIVNLKTSFGGGKTHTELAIYHLFEHPQESMAVPQVRDLVTEAGLDSPPPGRVAVLAGTRLSPTGRATDEGLSIRTLWGEMAYRLGGAPAFELVAESDARLVSPGEDSLEAVLRHVLAEAGSTVILLDETLHYVDKVSQIEGKEGDLAKQTVAFLRELTAVVDALPRTMLVVSLTASRLDQLSDSAQDWLERLEHHVNRLARACTPIEGTEIHEVVRRRLYDHVDLDAAGCVAKQYHEMYKGMGGLPAQYVDTAYRDLMCRSYPFHPELITILYERWGAKPGFQLTRGTLRFLALALQDLWQRRQEVDPDLIQMGHVSLRDSYVRAMVRDIAGDPQWESVLGSDVAAPTASEQQSKAEIIDEERADDLRLAQALATTILLYSLGGGENPQATRHEIRLSCSRQGVEDATWDDLLDKFRRRFFYLYYEDAHYQFRKEPNVTSLHHTYRVNIKDTGEADAHVHKVMLDKALGITSPSHGFAQVYYLPNRAVDRDDVSLKLVVLGFDQPMDGGKPSEPAQQAALEVLERHGQVLRQHRNTLVFCVPDRESAREARGWAVEYLSWRKIQQNPADWDRIGGTQQFLVKEQLENTESAALQAIIRAYSWVLVPSENKSGAGLAFRPVQLGLYGPGKLIAPMVWDTLTAKTPTAEWLLTTLTAETFLERYGAQAWPESEKWVTTAQLWNRFTSQVGLPILANEQVLLSMLNQGQHEGLLAIGSLTDAQAARDQRDSYQHLYFQETMPPNVPITGERWLVMRPQAYKQIAEQPEQVTPDEIRIAVEALGGGEQAVTVQAVHNYVTKGRTIDEESFRGSVTELVEGKEYVYRLDDQRITDLAQGDAWSMQGKLIREKAPPPLPKHGRTIVIQGALDSIHDMGPFFKKILQPIASQQPADLTIALEVSAHFDEDPGSGLDAALDDGFDNNAFPGLTRQDSKGSQ
jgi:hypothetical protein